MWSKHPRVTDRLSVLADATPAVGDFEFDAPPALRGPNRLLDGAPGAFSTEDIRGQGPGPRWYLSWDGRARKAALTVIAGLALVVVYWWWSGQPASVQPAESGVSVEVQPNLELVEVPGAVLVHVVGKVANPGVVELPSGSRVQDAIEAAGGATKDSALATVNLARTVVDGEQIVVGVAASGGSSSRISINSASLEQLQELPGVGPVIAERIVQWREFNGPFQSIDELTEVSGIGPSMIEQIRDLADM
jgi:competence protein ComEA